MDVDVDVLRVDVEIEEIRHLLALRHETLIDRHHGLAEIRMAHEAAVDEEELPRAFLLGRLGLAHEAADAAHRRLHLHGQQVLVDALAEDVDDALGPQARRSYSSVPLLWKVKVIFG